MIKNNELQQKYSFIDFNLDKSDSDILDELNRKSSYSIAELKKYIYLTNKQEICLLYKEKIDELFFKIVSKQKYFMELNSEEKEIIISLINNCNYHEYEIIDDKFALEKLLVPAIRIKNTIVRRLKQDIARNQKLKLFNKYKHLAIEDMARAIEKDVDYQKFMETHPKEIVDEVKYQLNKLFSFIKFKNNINCSQKNKNIIEKEIKLLGLDIKYYQEKKIYFYNEENIKILLSKLREKGFTLVKDELDGSILAIKDYEGFIFHNDEIIMEDNYIYNFKKELYINEDIIVKDHQKLLSNYVWFWKTLILYGEKNTIYIRTKLDSVNEFINNEEDFNIFSLEENHPHLITLGGLKYFSFIEEYSRNFNNDSCNYQTKLAKITISPTLYKYLIWLYTLCLWSENLETGSEIFDNDLDKTILLRSKIERVNNKNIKAANVAIHGDPFFQKIFNEEIIFIQDITELIE